MDQIYQRAVERQGEFISQIKTANATTRAEWLRRKTEAVERTRASCAMLDKLRENWINSAVEDVVKKQRAKNTESLARLAKQRRKSSAYLESLAVKFEHTVTEMANAERQRLEKATGGTVSEPVAEDTSSFLRTFDQVEKDLIEELEKSAEQLKDREIGPNWESFAAAWNAEREKFFEKIRRRAEADNAKILSG